MKSNTGDVRDCRIVEFWESKQCGEDRGEEMLAKKSPPARRFVLVCQPAGIVESAMVSKCSAYG